MSLRFTDSFDHYSTTELQNEEKWDTVVGAPIIHASAGRRGTQGLRCPSASSAAQTVAKTLDAQPTWIVGVAFTPGTLSTTTRSLISLLSGSSVVIELVQNSDGTLSVRLGDGTILDTSVFALSAGTTYYLEFKVGLTAVYSASLSVDSALDAYNRLSGSFTDEGFSAGQILYVAGFSNSGNNGVHAVSTVSALSLTVAEGLTTETATTVTYGPLGAVVRVDGVERLTVPLEAVIDLPDTIRLGPSATGNAVTWDWDDLVVCDGAGSLNTDVLGDCRVDCGFPSGAGAYSEWTGSYAAVDEAIPDDDSSYITSNVGGQRSVFTVEPFAALDGAGVKGVAVTMSAKKDISADRSLKGLVHSADTDSNLTPQAITSLDYAYYQFIAETDPATDTSWLPEAVNAAEYGVEVA